MLSFNNACNYPYSKEGGLRAMIDMRSIEEDRESKRKAKVKSILVKYSKN